MAERTVLQLLGPSTGGIRRHVAALSERLGERGWHAETAGPAGVLDGLAPLDHHVRVPMPGPALLGATRALRRAVERAEADVVHAHGLKAGWVAALARTGVPVVVTVHNVVLDEAAGAMSRLLRNLEGRLPHRVAATITVSESIAARFDGLRGADRVRVVRPVGPVPVPARTPAEVRADLGVDADAPLVVSLARLHPQKDVPTLLRAFALLRDEVPAARLAIFGEGPDGDALAALATELGVAGPAVFAGRTDDAAGALAAADAVAVSSLWEGSPLAVAEALELARPLVSTPVAAPQLLADGVSARVVPIGDAPALATALRDLLADPEGAARLGAEGRRRVLDLLDRDRLVGEVVAVYDDVLAGAA